MAERKTPGLKGRIELEGIGQDDQVPALAIHAISADNKVLGSARLSGDGSFTLPASATDRASRVVIADAAADPVAEGASVLGYQLAQARDLFETGLTISKDVLDRLRWRFACVSGSVRRCYPWLTLVEELVASTGLTKALSARSELMSARMIDVSLIDPSLVFHPYRCAPVCQGTVEVYRRTCCCQPPIWIDPDDIVVGPVDWPPPQPPPGDPPFTPPGDPPFPPPIPPGPGPDPAPLQLLERISTGSALDGRKLNAQRDAFALRTLRGPALTDYISIRPYLWCTCGGGTKVAQGLIADDGTFSVCWREFPRFQLPNCSDEYAYRVTQIINGVTVTVYDGPAAGQWFSAGTSPTLTSYSRAAIACREDPPVPGAGPHTVILHDIGSTESWHLGTPSQDSPDSVGSLATTSGLIDPAAVDGPYVNRPLGGGLGLRYDFLGMQGIATFYRVDMAPANASGDPAGPWVPVAVPQWSHWHWDGTQYVRSSKTLGPDANGLFRIPYDGIAPLNSGEQWDDAQFHAVLDSGAFPNGRYLVRIEVFNAAGTRIKPAGASGAGTAAGFTFGRWRIPAGPPDNVPWSALTHVLWWNNQRARATVEGVRLATASGSPTCQFLDGPSGAAVSIDYRAYHEHVPGPGEPSFLQGWALNVVKGIGGGTPLSTGGYGEPGKPPAVLPATDSSSTLASLLGTDPKCAFAVTVGAAVKTTNGSGRLQALDAFDIGAFAAEQH
ncbi:MAG: hypothetical protein ACJ761_11625 [Chloroflexota bacterium]